MAKISLSRIWAVLVLFLMAGTFPLQGLDKKEYKVFIVSDTLGPWSLDAQEGFKATLDPYLAAQGAKAAYTVLDTKVDPANTPGIVKAIREGKPDLVLTCNYPNGFADSQITSQFKGTGQRFVSLNPIPVEIGLIKDWKKPGGNVTGVGVFLQFTSAFKLAQRINPQLKKVAFVTWNAMGVINDWFESEIKSAAKETGLTLVEFARVNTNEEEMAFYKKYVPRAADTFISSGISAFVRNDGSPMDMTRDWMPVVQKDLGKLLFVTYDLTMVTYALPAATAVIWTDIGAQLAEKAIKVLEGAVPGDIAWEYPRKYNLIFNLQAAKDRGITIPQALISSAYRVYTDYQGNYVGQKK